MATTSRLTLAEFLAMPETEPASEFINGEVIQKPMPTGAHGILQSLLSMFLLVFVRGAGLGKVGSEWRCTFGPRGRERSFIPDLVYISNERLATDVQGFGGAHLGPPDLAVEILSPDQNQGRFMEKIQFYLAHGVRLVWIVDPEARIVTVLRPDHDGMTLSIGDVLDGEEILPGLTIRVADLFNELNIP